jgi:hypothetical protein
MPSQIDPTKPIDGVPASKADLRANLQSAKSEIEALQSGKADLGHQHGVADISDAGALASKDTVATADIADDAVTNAKLANMSAATFKGRAAGAGTGDPSDLTATQAKTALAISASDVSGLGTLATLSQVGTAQISDDAVTNAKLADMAAATLKGRAAGAGTGDPTDLTAAEAKTALAISASDVGGLGALATLNQVGTAQISDDAVTNAKLANMPAATFKGRAAGAGTGDPADLSAAQAKAALAISASDVSGLGALATLSQVGTAQISDDTVTYAKMQNVSAASRLLGRGQAGGAGDPEEIVLGSGLSMTGTTLSSESSFPVNDTTALVQDPVDNTKRARIDAGAVAPATTRTIAMGDRDVDLAAGGTFAEFSHTHVLTDITNAGTLAALSQVETAQIADDAVTNVKLANMAAATFKGRAAGAGTGDPTDLTAAQAKTALAISAADVSGLGALATLSQVGSAQIADDAVTNVKLANMAAATFKGRAAGAGTGDPTDLTAAQAKTALAISSADVSGLGALATLNQVGSAQIAAGALDGKPINMQGALLRGAEIIDYAETSATPVISAGVLTLDLDTASVFEVVLTANVTSLVFANPPTAGRAGSVTLILRQDATGGRTVAWPSSILWSGGTTPIVTPAANAVDVYGFITRNGGTTWYGFPAGKGFS